MTLRNGYPIGEYDEYEHRVTYAIDNTIAEMQRLRARVAELEKELKETQFSETSWRELAEYWESLCKAIMPK